MPLAYMAGTFVSMSSVSACLTLSNGLGLKGTVPVTGNADFALAPCALYGLFAVAIAAIAAIVSQNAMLFVAQMFIHLGFKHLFKCSGKQSFLYW